MSRSEEQQEQRLSSSSSEKTTTTLSKIRNFRDVSTFAHGLKPGVFFRSASAGKATKEDINVLLSTHKIKTMIDLRSDRERNMDDRCGGMYTSFSVVSSIRQGRYQHGRKIYQMRFIGTSFITRLLTEAPLSTSLKASAFLARGEPEKATLLLVSSLNTRGLLNLYNMFLENCKSQIAEVLQCFLEPANYPIHLYCNLGKDRTGLITALVLSCIGVPREDICADYSHSNEIDMSQSMADAVGQCGVDKNFLSAPKEIMQKTLEYLDLKYGSVANYLTRIGFDKHSQAQLRALLSIGEEHFVSTTDRKAVLRKLSKSTPDFFPQQAPLSKEVSLDLAAIALSASKGTPTTASTESVSSGSASSDDDAFVKDLQSKSSQRSRGHRHQIAKGYSMQMLHAPPLEAVENFSTSLTGPYLSQHRASAPVAITVTPPTPAVPVAVAVKHVSDQTPLPSAMKSSSTGGLHESSSRRSDESGVARKDSLSASEKSSSSSPFSFLRRSSDSVGNRSKTNGTGNGNGNANRSVRFADDLIKNERVKNPVTTATTTAPLSSPKLPSHNNNGNKFAAPGMLKKADSQRKLAGVEELSALTTKSFSSN